MIPIRVIKDDEGNIYFLPQELVPEWELQLRTIELFVDDNDTRYDLWDTFDDTFSKYKVEGNLSDYQLFISQDELKRLTNE